MDIGNTTFLQFPGDTQVRAEDLSGPKCRAFALAAQKTPFVKLIECRCDSKRPAIEIVIVEVEVERGQHVLCDIRRVELLAIEFSKDDQEPPAVLALRSDFPRVPHLNSLENDLPRSLCLYELPYSEVKLRWTPRTFIEWVRMWLAKTADGTLHTTDQPLEPLLLLRNTRLILPRVLQDAQPDQLEFVVIQKVESKLHSTFYAYAAKEVERESKPNGVVLSLVGAPHTHGVVERLPTDLRQLHALVGTIGINLMGSVRQAVRTAVNSNTFKDTGHTYLVLLISFPKLRQAHGKKETVERWAFMCTKTMQEVGEAVGALQISDGKAGYLLAPDKTKTGDNIPVYVLQPHFRLSREAASRYSGIVPNSQHFTFVGLGTLGSQVFLNLVRTGFGQWTLIDSDIVLPHNLARHALVNSLGLPKSEALANFGKLVIDENALADGIEADILSPLAKGDPKMESAMARSAGIVDCSASQAVARHLAIDEISGARRCSLFLNPAGTDLVLLCEPSDRGIRLDDLEAQYYRLVLRTRPLRNHLQRAEASIRYSTGCRDVSAVIRQDFVSMYGGIGSQVLKEILVDNDACICVWTLNQEQMETKQYYVVPSKTHSAEVSGWFVRYDEGVVQSIQKLRRSKLPSETGGILLGFFDTSRRIVYIADLLPAPPDSIERPTFFVRGSKGLRAALDSVTRTTRGQLEYVGEWHTHPDGCSVGASHDDKDLLEKLSRVMAEDGLPEVMLIAGEEGRLAVHLKECVSSA